MRFLRRSKGEHQRLCMHVLSPFTIARTSPQGKQQMLLF